MEPPQPALAGSPPQPPSAIDKGVGAILSLDGDALDGGAKDCRLAGPTSAMTPFYVAGVLLVIAQAIGIYALVSRKADFIFAVVMICLVAGALAAGADGAYTQLH